MSDLEFSLADLADLDVSGIEEVRYETHPQGLYEFEVEAAGMTEITNRDDEKRFVAEWKFQILEVKSIIDPKVTEEKRAALVGKFHTEKMYVNPTPEGKTPEERQQKIAEAIGRIKSFILDMGGEWNQGLLDNVANTKGLRFTGKLNHQPDKDDKSRVYARIKLEERKA